VRKGSSTICSAILRPYRRFDRSWGSLSAPLKPGMVAKKRLACSGTGTQPKAILLEANSREAFLIRFGNLGGLQKQVRPIVRGKTEAALSLAPKSASLLKNGFPFLQIASVGLQYNEGGDLIAQAEKYKKDNGCYPERICADSLSYINRENRHSA